MLRDILSFKETKIKSTTVLEFDGINLHSKQTGNFYLNRKQLINLLKDSNVCSTESEYKYLLNNIDKGYIKVIEGISIAQGSMIYKNESAYLYLPQQTMSRIQNFISMLDAFTSLREVGDTTYFTDFGCCIINKNAAQILIHINTTENYIEIFNLVADDIYFQPQRILPKTDISKVKITDLYDIINSSTPVDYLVDDMALSVSTLRDLLFYSKIIEPNKSKNKYKPPYKLIIAQIRDGNDLDRLGAITEIINENWNDPVNKYTCDTKVSTNDVLPILKRVLLDNIDYDIINMCEKMCDDIIPNILKGS